MELASVPKTHLKLLWCIMSANGSEFARVILIIMSQFTYQWQELGYQLANPTPPKQTPLSWPIPVPTALPLHLWLALIAAPVSGSDPVPHPQLPHHWPQEHPGRKCCSFSIH